MQTFFNAKRGMMVEALFSCERREWSMISCYWHHEIHFHAWVALWATQAEAFCSLPFFLKGRRIFFSSSITTWTCIISLLQQKGVPDFHKNCFLSPVKSNDAIVKNFFFLNWYAQGEYVGVKKILIKAVINSGINKQILGQ